jgi:hypothetical protein
VSEQLQPETLVRLLQAIDRRLHVLETTARVGLSRIQTAETAGPDTGAALVVGGAYGDLSVVGPEVDVTTGVKALVIGSSQIYLGPAAVYRNSLAKISYAVSGETTINPGVLSPCGLFSHDATAATAYDSATVTFVDLVTLNPGVNTFTMKYAYDGAIGGAASTPFINMVIVVIPLDL